MFDFIGSNFDLLFCGVVNVLLDGGSADESFRLLPGLLLLLLLECAEAIDRTTPECLSLVQVPCSGYKETLDRATVYEFLNFS